MDSRRTFLKRLACASLTLSAAGLAAACTAQGIAPTAVTPTSAAPAAAPATTAPAAVTVPTGKLEIFSWWTNPGEVEALNALFDIYKQRYPKVEIVNAAVAGGAGAGGNMKAVLKTRVLGGHPPDSFQAHFGLEITDTWARTGYLEPLDSLYASESWTKAFPKDLIDIVSWDGHPWSVVPNIHRGNVL